MQTPFIFYHLHAVVVALCYACMGFQSLHSFQHFNLTVISSLEVGIKVLLIKHHHMSVKMVI